MDVTSLQAQTHEALLKIKELRDTTENPRLRDWLTLRIAEAERMLQPVAEMPRIPRQQMLARRSA